MISKMICRMFFLLCWIWYLSLLSSLYLSEMHTNHCKWSCFYRWFAISATLRTRIKHLVMWNICTVMYLTRFYQAKNQIHEDLIESMLSNYIIDSLSALSLVFLFDSLLLYCRKKNRPFIGWFWRFLCFYSVIIRLKLSINLLFKLKTRIFHSILFAYSFHSSSL